MGIQWQNEKRSRRILICIGPTVAAWLRDEQRRLYQKQPGAVVRVLLEQAYERHLASAGAPVANTERKAKRGK